MKHAVTSGGMRWTRDALDRQAKGMRWTGKPRLACPAAFVPSQRVPSQAAAILDIGAAEFAPLTSHNRTANLNEQPQLRRRHGKAKDIQEVHQAKRCHNQYRYVRRIAGGVWLMKSVERNADLDDVTEEDIEEGALNDDQLQALWGRTLEEAQNEEFVEIVAAWLDAPRKTVSIDAAKTLYEAIRTHDAIMVSEPDRNGLLKG